MHHNQGLSQERTPGQPALNRKVIVSHVYVSMSCIIMRFLKTFGRRLCGNADIPYCNIPALVSLTNAVQARIYCANIIMFGSRLRLPPLPPWTSLILLRLPAQFPVHCAAAGGNLTLLTWLVEDRCCPVSCTMFGVQASVVFSRHRSPVSSKYSPK